MSKQVVEKEIAKLKLQRADIKVLLRLYQRKFEDIDRKIKELE